ncbi:sensor histidine kinase [Streptomyces sp. NPDC002680]|uniref:sensor histidine kinase n=1 Tax=Streptomyces sp. NPDC002680 TaxID=3364659 RepID=UPI0036A7A263
MFWMREVACQVSEWQAERARWRADAQRFRAARRAARKSGGRLPEPENPGPPPTGFTLLPWLLMGLGSFSNLLQGRTPQPWIGGLGLLAFNSLYVYVTFRAFVKEKRDARSTRVALALMGVVTCAPAIVYGGSWLYFFPLLGLATGAVMRGPRLGRAGLALTALAAAVSAVRDGWDALNIAYGTFLSTMVTAAILSLAEAVRELRSAREELARRAVEEERLRFSRDLHDLLGHTLSVIVVKSEAARRLAPSNMDAALLQITDIESVGRQALTEIREAVTGYRQGGLATELDRADSVLTAADITPAIHRSGPPLPASAEALLGWVVREAVTNVVRHSGAARCEITVESAGERVRLSVADDGTGVQPPAGSTRPGVGGTGLKGLKERLAAAGGSLEAGPTPRGGFLVTAELPTEVAAEPATEMRESPPSSQLSPHTRPTLTP